MIAAKKTIADGGTTVVTITCEEVGKFNYSVTTSVGSVIENGTLYNDETKTISWSKYIEIDGTYYQATAPFQFTVSKDAVSNEVSVKASQVKQFVEITSSNWAGTGVDNANLSGGIAYRGVAVGGTKELLTVEETGIYAINYAVFSTNTGADKQFDFSLYKNDASDDTNLIETFSVNHSVNYVLTTGTRTVENVVLQAGDKIIAKSGNTTCALDYIALAKFVVPATITSADANLATYVNGNYALDFTDVEGLKAYIVTGTDGGVATLQQVTKVPAGTGVILEGDVKTYEVPVIAAADAIEGNLLKAAIAETAAVEGDYVVAYKNEVRGFFPAEEELKIPAGKAYLHIDTEGGAPAFLPFAAETTGISATLVNSEVVNNEVYNLAGQRVAKPTKGLYIVGGRKVVVK